MNNLDAILEAKGGDKVETLTAVCRGLWDTCIHHSEQIREMQQKMLHLEHKIRELEEK